MSILRKICPYFSLFSDVLSYIIERAITSLLKDELMFVSKTLLFKHPINRKTLNIWICEMQLHVYLQISVREVITDGFENISSPIFIHAKSDRWYLRKFEMQIYKCHQLSRRKVIILTTSNMIHNDQNFLFTRSSKNTNSFLLNEFTVELSTKNYTLYGPVNYLYSLIVIRTACPWFGSKF